METIERCGVEQDRYFAFRGDSLPVHKQQRTAGFGSGRLRTKQEEDFEAAQMRKRGEFRVPRKPTMTVSPNEADISVGARSSRAVILSLNKNTGPIRDASQGGGKVIFLNDFDDSGMSLREFILQRLQ